MGTSILANLKLPNFALPFLGGKERLSIGLDIGSHAVKLCELAPVPGGGYQLCSLGSAMLPSDSLEDGALRDPEAVGRVVATLLDNLKVKHKKVAISISGYSVIVKKINLAVMSSEDLEKHIQAEAEQYIPFDIDDVYLDFQDLKTNTEEENRTDVMLVAAKREVVDGYLTMLRTAGLQPVVVDVDAFALQNAYEASCGAEGNVVLVDIGASKMNINIIANGTSVLARDVVLGSRQLTEQLQHQFDLSLEEAEQLKTGEAAAGDRRAAIEDIFANACSQWVTEVKRAIDFYYSSHPDETISRIVLSGGGARIKGLAEYFQQESGIATELFNPFRRAAVDATAIDPAYLEAVAPEMAIAAGLATRPAEV
ncbi:MAG: type IV pilus biogenesis protein PilM [Thermodesulfobacteriota bacterium]